MEFLNFRGQQLEATIISTGGQDFVIAPVGDRLDAMAALLLRCANGDEAAQREARGVIAFGMEDRVKAAIGENSG